MPAGISKFVVLPKLWTSYLCSCMHATGNWIIDMTPFPQDKALKEEQQMLHAINSGLESEGRVKVVVISAV